MTRKRRRFNKGVEITPENIEGGTGAEDLTRDGEFGVDANDNKVKIRLDSATRSVVTEDQTQTLTNKTIDGTDATGTNTVTADATDITYDNSTSGLTATTSQAAIDETDARLDQDIQDLADHEAETTGAHAASAISYDNSTSGLTATDTQSAVDEVEGRLDTAESAITDNANNLTNHINDTTDAHDASAISYDNSTSGLTATETQAAVDEVEGRLDTAESDIASKPTLTATDSQRLVRTDGTTAIQDSGITVDDFDRITGVTDLEVDDIKINSAGISSVGGNEIDYTIISSGGSPIYSSEYDQNLASTELSGGINGTSFRMGQAFTTTTGYDLGRISIGNLSRGVTTVGDITVDIYATSGSLPTGASLGTSDPIDSTTLPTVGNATFTFDFSTPISLSSTTTYAFVIKKSLITGNILFDVDNANEYPSVTFVGTSDSGSTWQDNVGGFSNNTDLEFELFSATLPSTLAAHSFNPSIGIDYEEITASGANVELTISKGNIRLTNAALVSIAGLTTPATQGFQTTLTNVTGNDIKLVNDATVSGTKILTGTKKDLTLKDQASIRLTYDNASNTFYVIGGTGADSGQGGINYITNPDAETGLDGWTEYADASQDTPEDGVGLPTFTVSLTASETAPLRDNASFLISKLAADGQGEGISVDFDIDNADLAKMIQISCDYNTSSDYVDGDFKIFIFDKDNSEFISVINPDILAIGSGLTGRINTYFQSKIDVTSYRLILHNTTVNSDAYEIRLDNVRLGPVNTSSAGAFISDFSEPIPVSTSWGASITGTCKYMKMGSIARIQYTLDTLVGAMPAVLLTVDMPAGLTIDHSSAIKNDADNYYVGGGFIKEAGTNWYPLNILADGVTNVLTVLGERNPMANDNVGSTFVINPNPILMNAGDSITFTIDVPIVGWETGIKPNEVVSGRLHTFSTINTGGQSIPSGVVTKITDWGNPLIDESGAWDAVNQRYIVQETGTYEVSTSYFATDGGTDLTRVFVAITANGSQVAAADNVILNSSVIGTLLAASCKRYVKLNAGDLIESNFYQENSSAGAYVTQGPSDFCTFEISKLNNMSSQITPAETVAARYSASGGQILTHGVTTNLQFDNKFNDTHNMLSGGDTITIPINGFYQIDATSWMNNFATTRMSTVMNILVNGSSALLYGPVMDCQGDRGSGQMSGTVYLNAGDSFVIQNFHTGNGGANDSVFVSGNPLTSFSIIKVGN